MEANYSVIVYGKTGCGKSTNAERIRAHLGLTHVVDDFDPIGRAVVCKCGVLYLTADMRAPNMHKSRMVKVMAYEKVMAEIEAAAPAEPTTLEKLIEQAPNLARTGWISCTTPPVRDGVYEFTMFPNETHGVRGEYRAGEWIDMPGIVDCPREFYWRGVRRWVLQKPSTFSGSNAIYLRKEDAGSIEWTANLAWAMGFDTEREASAILDNRWPFGMGNAKAVLP